MVLNKIEYLVTLLHDIDIKFYDKSVIASLIIARVADEYKSINLREVYMVIDMAELTGVLISSPAHLGILYSTNEKYTSVTFADILKSHDDGIPLEFVLRRKKIERIIEKTKKHG